MSPGLRLGTTCCFMSLAQGQGRWSETGRGSDAEAWHFNLLQKVKHGWMQHQATFSWCHIAHEIEFRWDLNTRFDIKYGNRVKMKATIAPKSKTTTRGPSTEQQRWIRAKGWAVSPSRCQQVLDCAKWLIACPLPEGTAFAAETQALWVTAVECSTARARTAAPPKPAKAALVSPLHSTKRSLWQNHCRSAEPSSPTEC